MSVIGLLLSEIQEPNMLYACLCKLILVVHKKII